MNFGVIDDEKYSVNIITPARQISTFMVKEPAFPQLENTRGSTSFHIPTPSTTKGPFFIGTAKDCNALPVNSPLLIPPKAFHLFILLLTGKAFDSLSFGLKSFIVH